MSINKLNMEGLKLGINSLKKWHEIHEEILDKLGLVKEKLEYNEGTSIEQTLDTIENFEDSIKERSREIQKKYKEVQRYKEKLDLTGVMPLTPSAHIFIENIDYFKKKIKNLQDDTKDNKKTNIYKIDKYLISWSLEKEEKEDLELYIDQKNILLNEIQSYFEDNYISIENKINSTLVETKKLKKMENTDDDFSISVYNVVKKMIEINIESIKITVKAVTKLAEFVGDHAHLILTGLGCIPVVGWVADATNAILYGVEGDFKNAALSGLSIVPGLGASIAATKTVKSTTKGMEFASDTFKTFKAYQKGEEAFSISLEITDETLKVIDKVDKIYDTAKKVELGLEAVDLVDSYMEVYIDAVDGNVEEIPADLLKSTLEKYDLAKKIGGM